MPQEFPRATLAEMLGQTLSMFGPARADSAGLPKGVLDRLETLREDADSKHRLMPTFEERHELATEKVRAEQRLKRLTDHPTNGGFGLDPVSDPRVIEQRRLVEKLTSDQERLNARYERTSSESQAALRVLTACEAWLRDGKPLNTVLEDHEVPPPALQKGESLVEGVERYRRRARELQADLARIAAAPMPASYARERMRQEVETLVQLGAPVVSQLIEHADGKLVWPSAALRSTVYNTEVRSMAVAETTDALALVAWLHPDQLIKQLDALIAEESDDAAALSIADRERQTAVVQADLLAAEREECALIRQAQTQGMPVEFRADCHPLAVLGGQLRTITTVNQPGSSPGYSYDLVGASRQR